MVGGGQELGSLLLPLKELLLLADNDCTRLWSHLHSSRPVEDDIAAVFRVMSSPRLQAGSSLAKRCSGAINGV